MKNITHASTYIFIHTPVRLPLTLVLFHFITYDFGVRVFCTTGIPKPPCTYRYTYINVLHMRAVYLSDGFRHIYEFVRTGMCDIIYEQQYVRKRRGLIDFHFISRMRIVSKQLQHTPKE